MINAIHVGNSILSRAFLENIDITPMKLQKLIYFTYQMYLKETGIPLFEERFETWKYGPVISSVYTVFKKYGANAIRQYATEPDGKTIFTVNEDASPIFKRVLDFVWSHCKTYDGIYLSSITHRFGSAWNKAAENGHPYLSDEDIKSEVITFG